MAFSEYMNFIAMELHMINVAIQYLLFMYHDRNTKKKEKTI